MFNNNLATFRLLYAGQVLSDPPRLNPLYLSLGTNAYRIQSQTLGISDHFGMFSAGPPRLQAYEAGNFLKMGFVLHIILFWASFTLAICWAARNKNFWWIALLLSALILGTAAYSWAVCCQRTGRRADMSGRIGRWNDGQTKEARLLGSPNKCLR